MEKEFTVVQVSIAIAALAYMYSNKVYENKIPQCQSNEIDLFEIEGNDQKYSGQIRGAKTGLNEGDEAMIPSSQRNLSSTVSFCSYFGARPTYRFMLVDKN